MDDNLFFCNIEMDSDISEFLVKLKQYSAENSVPVYAIKKPLVGQGKLDYDYHESVVILVPKHKIIIANYGNNCNDFEDFVDDFTSDLESLSKKYEYVNHLGRKRNWEKSCVSVVPSLTNNDSISKIVSNNKVQCQDERKVELLISLLIGSINDIDSVGVEVPELLLDKIKKKIILFDGMQSRFIYETLEKKVITIQGLAGTGKTELLLHKLKELYISEKESKIAFTCHNKVLAQVMRDRLPSFFNFMKVNEQIDPNRLFVYHSWGSNYANNRGLYSHICMLYKLDILTFSSHNTFNVVCKQALEELKAKDFEPFFDYIFIDESQDFTQEFFDLCEIVTKKQVCIAGDIFQNVFDRNIKPSINMDFLLNKCYRTEPKTLMIAHAIGLGLYEGENFLRWLEDSEWEACGYDIRRESGKAILSRSPIRRFDDINETFQSINIREFRQGEEIKSVIKCIQTIVKENTSITPEDIAIVFLGDRRIYNLIDQLAFEIYDKLGWDSTKAYNTKSKERNKVCLTNINNVKGLEFPFIVCIETGDIDRSILKRNSIYTVLTRSFICSYFLVPEGNSEFVSIYSSAIEQVNTDNYMSLIEPTKEAKENQLNKITIETIQKKFL